jgi:hypothetical protein
VKGIALMLKKRRASIIIFPLIVFSVFLILSNLSAAVFSSYEISDTSIVATESTAGEDAGQKNVVKLDDGMLIAVWEDNDNDVRCAQSVDGGVTWINETEITAGTYRHPSIATNGTRAIITVEETNTDDIQYSVSDTGCPGFSSLVDATGLTTTMGEPVIAYDGTADRWVMCVFGPGTDPYFANVSVGSESGTWSLTEIQDARTMQSCAIDINDSGNIFVAIDDSQGSPDHVRLYNSSDSFSTVTTQDIYTGSAVSVSINVRSNHVIVTAEGADNDLFVLYSDDSGATFSSSEYDTFNVIETSGCIDVNGLYHLAVINDDDSDSLYYFNHSGSGGFGTPVELVDVGGSIRFPTGRCSNFPEGNRMGYNTMELSFVDRTSTDSFDFGSYSFGDQTNGTFISPDASQEFMGNEIVEIEFNETNETSVIYNVTFLINGAIYQGLNNTSEGDDYWVYNWTVPTGLETGELHHSVPVETPIR